MTVVIHVCGFNFIVLQLILSNLINFLLLNKSFLNVHDVFWRLNPENLFRASFFPIFDVRNRGAPYNRSAFLQS